jgi:putative ABC transport system permease protein
MSNPGELPQVFQPLGIEELESDDRASGGSAIARLKPSVTPAQLQSELDSILRQIAREHPADYPHDVEVVVQLLEEKLTSKVRRPLLVLSAAVSFLLLITCANVANLLLTRSIARSTEMALRSALGSGQWRLARLVLTESMVVAAIGGLAGIGLAYAGVRALLAYAPPEVPRLAEVRIDASVLLFAAAVILFSGVIFGALPALRIGRIDLNETLRAGHVGEREWSRARRTLAVVEIAAAFVLATGTGLLLRSLDKLLHVEAGYDSHDILTMAVFLKDYSSERAGPNWRAIIERVRAVPGIENAAMVSTVPLSQPVQNSLEVEHGDITRVADLPIVDQYYASPEYLRVMRIRLMRGRFFDENDRLGSAPVAVVSESCARLNFPGGDPVGRRIRMGDRDGDGSRDWMTVVGIAGDVRQHGMDAGPGVGVYLPQSQHPNFYYRLVARTASNPWRYYPAVRSALRELDPMQPMFHVQPMDDYVIKSLADRIFALSLMGLLGSVALVLGGVGIYGVLSYTVSLRGHEIGVRMALGADSSAVYRLIGKDVLLMLAGGLAAGGVATMVCNRLIVHLLYGVDSTDPIATFGSACVLSVVSLAAAFVPCRRAVNIDPARTLHEA